MIRSNIKRKNIFNSCPIEATPIVIVMKAVKYVSFNSNRQDSTGYN